MKELCKTGGKLFHQEWQHSVAEEAMREETVECRTQLGSANRRLGMNVGQWSHRLEHLHPIFQPQLLYFWTNFPLIHNLWGCRWWLEYLYSITHLGDLGCVHDSWFFLDLNLAVLDIWRGGPVDGSTHSLFSVSFIVKRRRKKLQT